MAEPPDATPVWHVVALVGRQGSRDVLVETHGGPPRLPRAPEPMAIEPFGADAVLAIATLLGRPVVPLRLAWLPQPGWQSGTIVVEAEPMATAPDGYRWLDPAGVLDVLEPEEARPTVRRWLGRADGEAQPNEPPWARPGWLARTAGWMVDRMAEAGCAADEVPRMVYLGPVGAVLRARSGDAALYLKCAAPAFPHEASITHALARRSPGSVPAVIASEPAENWLLMRDHGGRLLDAGDEGAWSEAMAPVAALQRSWIGWTDELVAAGGQVRPLADLAAAAPAMLDRDGLGGRIAPEDREAWTAAIPRLQDACGALLDLGLPTTLVHGDLHPGNVVVGADGFVVVDWSDGAVGHPFVDLATFILRAKDHAIRRRLLGAYLDGWDGVLPRARLEAAGERALAVGALYQVATYQALLPAMDTQDRALFDGADASWLRRTLRCLEDGLDAAFP